VSYKATNWAYEMKITGPAKPVLVALADMADEDASCYPGQERIASMTGLSVATVRRALVRLERLGLLTRERRNGAFGYRTSDRYRLQLSVFMPESLPLTVPTRQRALKAVSPSLPLTVQLPTAHSERAIEPSVEPLEELSGGAPSPFCSKHPTGTTRPCVACGNARLLYAASKDAARSTTTSIPPRTDEIPEHAHKWTVDGTCAICPARREEAS
jgi:DNA-binding IclR family transcriptional regulator